MTDSSICGGLSRTFHASEKVQSICDKVRDQVVAVTGKNYGVFTAIKFSSQVVNGINYFIKVHVGGCEYMHLCVWEKLPCNGEDFELTNLQENKTHGDPIEPF